MKQAYFIDTEKNRIELLDARFYRDPLTGQLYPSVTTILSAYPKTPQFYEWLKAVGEKADEIRDEFGKRGSVVHQLTEIYDLEAEVCILDENGKPQYTSMEWCMFERYVNFCQRFKPEILLVEADYVSPSLGFAGTLDRVIRLEGKTILMDIKTSNSIHEHYWLQQAAYVKMYEEKNPGQKIDATAILHLNSSHRTEGKNGAIQGIGWCLKFSDNTIEHDWQAFQATYLLWKRAMEPQTKPKNVVYQLTHAR